MMELVIKIPDEEYRWIKKSDETVFANVASKECMLHAIKNGIPLPEHHGRLIDVDELHHKMGEWLKPQKADETVMVALDDIAISTMMEIEETPTIIEADRGE